MERTHDGSHGDDCFGCRIQSIRLGAEATASRTKNKVLPRQVEPTWEKGIAGEHRPGGGFMPYLKPGTHTPMGVKEASQRRRQIDEFKRRRHHARTSSTT